jgi:hypothetical protein
VRANPGGKGFPLTKATHEQVVSVDIEAIRTGLAKYLEDASQELEFSRSDRPLALKNLKLIAYIQNDSTGDVLAAAVADLPGK